MAVARIGRVIYLQAADSPFNALYDAKEFVDIEMILVYAPNSVAALLTLYSDIVVTDDTRNIGQFGTTAGAAGAETEQFSFPWRSDMPPASFKGLSATLTGTGAKAWIYIV